MVKDPESNPHLPLAGNLLSNLSLNVRLVTVALFQIQPQARVPDAQHASVFPERLFRNTHFGPKLGLRLSRFMRWLFGCELDLCQTRFERFYLRAISITSTIVESTASALSQQTPRTSSNSVQVPDVVTYSASTVSSKFQLSSLSFIPSGISPVHSAFKFCKKACCYFKEGISCESTQSML